jgi:very-short-patch-repair endonuclease
VRAPEETMALARRLRRNLSPPEVRLWIRLRERKSGTPVFRRQHPIGPYVLDFFCAKARLAVEIDGRTTTWAIDRNVTQAATTGLGRAGLR